MSKSQKIQIPFLGSTPRVIHMATTTSGIVSESANPGGKIPKVVVKFRAPKSTLRRKETKGGKYYRKKNTMRKYKKSRKQTKKKGKKHRKSSKKSRKIRK